MSHTNETNGKREVLRLEVDVPVAASMIFDDGLPVNGRFGDQMMYTITHEAREKVIYLDPPVVDMIEQLGIKRGEHFQIGKFRSQDGNRRGVDWRIRRLEPEEVTPALDSTTTTEDGPLPAAPWGPEEIPASPPKASGAAPPSPPGSNGTARIAQHTRDLPQPTTPAPQPRPAAPTTGPHPQTPTPFAGSQDGQYILSALVNMVDVCSAVTHYASAKGLELAFSAEDVRALAITCFINSKGGGRR